MPDNGSLYAAGVKNGMEEKKEFIMPNFLIGKL
jgi:hypothetical protein